MTTAINKTNIRTNTTVAGKTFDKATLAMLGGASMVVGVWAAACFVGAMVTVGPIGLVRGFITAVTGI